MIYRNWTPLMALLIFNGTVTATELPRTEYKIVVNEANPLDTIERDEVSKLFLKRVLKWEHGADANPVDLKFGSALRANFSEIVHRRDTLQVKSYWQRQIFSGRTVPPIEVDSESAVLEIVGSDAGAIGYVSIDAELSQGIKELVVVE